MDVARCEVYELLPVVCHTEFVYGQHEIVSEKPTFRNLLENDEKRTTSIHTTRGCVREPTR